MADKEIILTDIGTHIQEWAHMGKACHKVIAEMILDFGDTQIPVRIENPQFKVHEEGEDTVILSFSKKDSLNVKQFEKEFLGMISPIKCAECGSPIEGGEKFVKENCLYQEKDWTNCLCPDCTNKWRFQFKGED